MIVFWGHDAALTEGKKRQDRTFKKTCDAGLASLTEKLEENWIHQNKREMEWKKELIEM